MIFKCTGRAVPIPIQGKKTSNPRLACSTLELLAKEMDYLNTILHRNSYPDWFMKKKKKTKGLIWTKPPTRKLPWNPFVTVPYIQELSEEFRILFKDTQVQIIFKGCNTLKTLLMHPKDKIPRHLCQDVVYQWTCTNENCNSSYIGKSRRCSGSRIKEHNTSSTSTIFQHCTTDNHPDAKISQFKIIDQKRKQVSREAIHKRRNNLALI